MPCRLSEIATELQQRNRQFVCALIAGSAGDRGTLSYSAEHLAQHVRGAISAEVDLMKDADCRSWMDHGSGPVISEVIRGLDLKQLRAAASHHRASEACWLEAKLLFQIVLYKKDMPVKEVRPKAFI